MFLPPPSHICMNGLLTPLAFAALWREERLEVPHLPSEIHPLVFLQLGADLWLLLPLIPLV